MIHQFISKAKNNPDDNKELMLISYQNESTVMLSAHNSANISNVMCKLNSNNGWVSYSSITTPIQLNKGEYVQFKNLDTCGNNTAGHIQFIMTGLFHSRGTIINKNHTSKSDRFNSLFKDCKSLLSGPNFILREFKQNIDGVNDYYTDRGLSSCFEGCSNLVSVRKNSFFK